ncbi:MAG TPA: HDOD domain-containing protein [Bryobacteraceae bacterium]|nr:HDOD domain-containing protein [Bryobacteraceae bacterium]
MSGQPPEVVGKDLPSLSKIPAFPPIVLRVLDLASNEEVDVRQLVELITADTALSAQLLRLANSPLFGMTARIDSVQHALVVLGLRRVHNLAMTAATSHYLRSALRIKELHRCWLHSLACALLNAELARLVSQPEDTAYTAGLLHDIGRLGLLVAHPEKYVELLQQLDGGGDALELERQAFGLDHCEAGEILAQRWGLPVEIQQAARRHHEAPNEGAGSDLLLWVSCQMADTLGFWAVPNPNALPLERLRELLPLAARERFSLDPAYWKQLIASRLHVFDGVLNDAVTASESCPVVDSEPPSQRGHDLPAPAPEPAAAPVGSQASTPERRVSTLSADIVIVAITSLVFTGVFFLMLYLMNR